MRIDLVSGPSGIDHATVLFSEGIELHQDDIIASVERPGNVTVEILDANDRKATAWGSSG